MSTVESHYNGIIGAESFMKYFFLWEWMKVNPLRRFEYMVFVLFIKYTLEGNAVGNNSTGYKNFNTTSS